MFAAFASGDNGTRNENGAASGSEDNDADDTVFVDDANQQSHSIVEDTTAIHTNAKAVEAKQALEASLLARRQRGGASGSEGKARVAPPVTVSSLSSGGGLTPVAEKSAFAAAASGSLSFNSGTFVEEQIPRSASYFLHVFEMRIRYQNTFALTSKEKYLHLKVMMYVLGISNRYRT